MAFRDPGWGEWLAIGFAVYVFTALVWLLGVPFGPSVVIVAGPVCSYFMLTALVGRVSLLIAERVRAATVWIVGAFFACLLAWCLWSLSTLAGWC